MRILHVSFLIFVLAFLIFEVLKLTQVSLPEWTTSYLNDFLCMPIVLTVCLKAVHHFKKDSSITLSLSLILILTSFYAVYFELVLPQISDRYTADFIDVIVYFSGTFLFYFLQYVSFRKSGRNRKAA
ncbi:hypothetical protein RM545_16270 [Zunongwangia sp. F260]|uniref:Magnesium citrate secondary transporter n=1 Tax=Autumnicola lenta TaxID=3075593 RepID=A0ABU3CQP3_9FLAO|nr:hypothetical protein [Zunongwangia sp. F260]MDT0648250.1 hypothetical protein [Zunongwangia sp. F260]